MSKINSMLIPNISTIQSEKSQVNENRLKSGEVSEFKKMLDGVEKAEGEINLSTHAMKRLQERNIEFDSDEYMKLREAAERLRSKGGHDSLVITNKAAYVLDVDKGMIVTAVDKNNMGENVFTKIDSTIFMN